MTTECQITVSLAEAQRQARRAYAQGLEDERRRLTILVEKFQENARFSAGTGASAWLSASYLLRDALGA